MHCAHVGATFKTFDQNFQEENPLKLKSLAVITLLVLGCSAAFGQSFSLGFLGVNGVQYCDYEVVNVSAPYAGGTHNLTTVCGLAADGVMVGFNAYIPLTSGATVVGNVVEMADNTFDAEYQSYTGCQIDWVTKTKPSRLLYHYGWAIYYSCFGGTDYLLNYGYLTTMLGAKVQVGAKNTSFGTAAAAKALHQK
jgi:hypothetical protein